MLIPRLVHVVSCVLYVCCLSLPHKNRTLLDAIIDLNATKFLELANSTGLKDKLTQKEPLTVFVPSNEAFENLPKEEKSNLQDVDYVKSLLQYHVLHGNHTRDLFYNEATYKSEYTPEGADKPLHVRINIYHYGQTVTASGSSITGFDHVASNGILHVLSRVMYLWPGFGSVAQLMFLPITRYMGYGIIDGGIAEMLNKRDPFTIMAPVDTAFEALPNSTLNLLKGNVTAIRRVMLNHIFTGTWYTSGMREGDTFTTLLGETVSVDSIQGNVSVNGSIIALSDVPGTNGVAHFTTKVFMPLD